MPIDGTDHPKGRRAWRCGWALALTVLALAPAPARAEGALVTAAVGSGTAPLARQVPLPSPLGEADAARYRKIFDLQEMGQWALADREIRRLGDRLLVGHLLAQRYLHANYRTPFRELKEWLDAYADHPDAEILHRLAEKRRPKGGPALKAPRRGGLVDGGAIPGGDEGAYWERFTVGGGDRVRVLKAQFRRLVRKGASAAAGDMLGHTEVRRHFGAADIDELKTILANAHYGQGSDELAARHAGEAAARSGHLMPQAHWTAGLALWRLGRLDEARRHFETVANARGGSPWMVSAGAYWAARANLKTRRPQFVNHWLELAAQQPRTFYGLLARRALRQPLDMAWEARPLTDADLAIMTSLPGGRRALALLQLGRTERAEAELRKLFPGSGPAQAQAMLAVADAAAMPALTLSLGTAVAAMDGRFHDSASYPLPAWAPRQGWSIDKALVFAIVRQESRFNPEAVSHAGAQGLMQVMPATARHLAGGQVERSLLRQPDYNLTLGQDYLRRLLAEPAIGNNLMFLAAAYNAGPGNLLRWQRGVAFGDDPLLFIESIPSPETRVFVERVLANLWIYRHRLGQPSPSLDAVAAGAWPMYDAMDVDQKQVAANVPNR